MSTGPAARGGDWRTAGPATRGDDWRNRAACLHLGDPDFMFGARNRAESVHICLTHCLVQPQCHAYASQLRPTPTDCVMGGIPFRMYHDRPSELAAQPDAVNRCRLCPGGPR